MKLQYSTQIDNLWLIHNHSVEEMSTVASWTDSSADAIVITGSQTFVYSVAIIDGLVPDVDFEGTSLVTDAGTCVHPAEVGDCLCTSTNVFESSLNVFCHHTCQNPQLSCIEATECIKCPDGCSNYCEEQSPYDCLNIYAVCSPYPYSLTDGECDYTLDCPANCLMCEVLLGCLT